MLVAFLLVGCDSSTAVRLILDYPATTSEIRVRGHYSGGESAFEETPFSVPTEGQASPTSGTIAILLPKTAGGRELELEADAMDGLVVVGTGSVAVGVLAGQTVDAQLELRPDPPVCGDGRTHESESCDDGNTLSRDGCSEGCLPEEGFACSGEPSTCAAVCGDAKLRGQEACDDGDTEAGDGCGPSCLVELAWICDVQEPSVCEVCRPATCGGRCGDGQLQGQQACDDGNIEPGDGCSDRCTIEGGYVCVLAPSICITKTSVAFVDAANCKIGATGTDFDPYCEINHAMLREPAPQLVLVAAGAYNEKVVINSLVLRLLAAEGATLSADRAALSIEGTASVQIDGLRVTGPEGRGGGVSVKGSSSALFSRGFIGPSDTVGLHVSQSAFVRVEKTYLMDNSGGGLKLDSTGGYEVENCVIAANGKDTSKIGGVELKRTTAESRFVNNTVADNVADSDDDGIPGGINCLVDAAFVNSILWNNVGGAPHGLSDRCLPRYSDIEAANAMMLEPGLGNLSADPLFIDPLYHISTSTPSPCVDTGDPAGTVPNGPAPVDDIDEQERRIVDIGADEAR